MGTQFFWVYDTAIAAVIISVAFKCWKKGAAATILRFGAFVVALAAALMFSGVVSDAVYDSSIREPLSGYITQNVNESIGENIVTQLNGVDMSKAYVNGKRIDELETEIDNSGRVTFDVEAIDVSETGLAELDLSLFGINKERTDFAAITVGLVQFTRNELDEYGIEKLMLAKLLTVNVRNGAAFGVLCDISDKISEVMPLVLGSYSAEVNSGKNDAVYKMILGLVTMENADPGEAVMNSVIAPVVKVPLRALIFAAIFAIIMILVEIIANVMKIINKIPVLGSINAFLGGLLGIAEGLLICVLISIFVQVLIALTDNSLIFINTLTIDKTILFKYLYNFELINFFA